MAKETEYTLHQDRKGMMWDLLLYIPTLIALVLVASKLWYGGNERFSYILVFLTTFIFLIAFNRIAKSRMMLLPSAPVKFSVSKKGVTLTLKSGNVIELVKDVRFFTDMAGKSFGLTGIDLSGSKQQFVFHKGQFASQTEFDGSKAQLRIFK